MADSTSKTVRLNDQVLGTLALPDWMAAAVEEAHAQRAPDDELRWIDVRNGMANAVPPLPEPEPEPKTVRVRVAAIVTPDGDFAVCGWNPNRDTYATIGESWNAMRDQAQELIEQRCEQGLVWLEATLPLPSAPTVEAEVKP